MRQPVVVRDAQSDRDVRRAVQLLGGKRRLDSLLVVHTVVIKVPFVSHDADVVIGIAGVQLHAAALVDEIRSPSIGHRRLVRAVGEGNGDVFARIQVDRGGSGAQIEMAAAVGVVNDQIR